MKTHILAALAALGMGVITAGWFWSMGCTMQPGEKLGMAYGCTAFCAGGVYALVLCCKKTG